MFKKRISGLGTPRATLLLFAVALALLATFLGLMLLTVYRDAQNRAETRVTAYSLVVSANIQWLMEASYQALRRMDIAIGDTLAAPPATAITDLNAAVGSLPVSVQGWVFDAAGDPRLTNARTTQQVNARDRDYFIATRDGAEFYISALLTSRSSGEQVFVIAKRIERHGSFVGTAIIVVPATYMDSFRSSLELGPKSTVGLLRDDGMLVSRSPVPAEATDLSKYILFTDYLKKADAGTYMALSPTDNVERIVGYQRVPGYPLVAIAAISMNEAFAGFWQTVGLLAAFAGPGVLALLIFALLTTRAQEKLSAALERNQILLREIHHRVKNNLQQVSALVSLQPVDQGIKEEMARRIGAMVAVHEHMYRSDAFETVVAADYLPPLIDGVRTSFAKPVDLTMNLAAAVIDRDHALPLALICNEVIGNAIKHGFPDGRRARISVVLEKLDPQRAILIIRDNGAGYDPQMTGTGMGNRLVKGLAVQLAGKMAIAIDGGTLFSLEFPVLRFD